MSNSPNCDGPLVGKKSCNQYFSNLCIDGKKQSTALYNVCLDTSCKKPSASVPATGLTPAGSTPKSLKWGVNGHPLSKRSTVFASDTILDIMKERGLTEYRIDVNLGADTDSYIVSDFQSLYQKAKARGIELKPMLSVPFT